ncbi:MAG: Gfo/Idh/MocA family protein [Pirellulaceae bacterium]
MSARSPRLNRRRFLMQSAAGAGALIMTPTIIPSSALGRDRTVAPSERIVMGGLGIGSRGGYDLGIFLDEPAVQFIAVADVRAERRTAVKQMVDSKYGNSDCDTYWDMFEMLARDDIDACLIATGDRWHTQASIETARAGKDMYCEKPCSMTIAESRALADNIARYGRVYQAGTQRRNIANFILAIELAHSGKLGKLHTVHANTLDPATKKVWLEPQAEPAPDVVHWDRWLGPTPWRPYNESYVQGAWRGYFDFHGGGILEWGAHTVDLCQWANQADDSAPVQYEPQGTNVVAHYANGVKLVMRDKGWMGLGTCAVRFEGEEGWVETGDSGRIEMHPASLRAHKQIFNVAGTTPTAHIQEFLQCVKSRRMPAGNANVACQSHIACHAAYIAWQLGRTLQFDPLTNEFPADAEANRLRCRALRAPWQM